MIIRNVASFVLVLVTFVLIWVYLVRKRYTPSIRQIPALDSIGEAIGRSSEMGRPIYYCMGGAATGGALTAGALAAVSLMRHTAKLAGPAGTKILAGTSMVDHIPIIDEALRAGYTEGGAPERYNFADILWFASQSAYISGTAALYSHSNPPASQLLVGTFMDEALSLCEIGKRGGAFMIGGTDYLCYMPLFVAFCDYTLIGEEMFAAGALVSGDAPIISSLAAEDLLKWIAIGLTLITSVTLATNLGASWLTASI